METIYPRAVIFTALPIERTAVLEHLRDPREEPHARGTVYRRGVFNENSAPWEVLLAEIGAGNEAAAAEIERAIAHFDPQVAIFVGIAGAIKDLTHGDVVTSTEVYNYESGKDTKNGFLPRPKTELPAYALRERARFEAAETDWYQRIRHSGNSEKSPTTPQVRLGPIAAGPKVVASTRSATCQFIREHYGDALAVDMEGYGFLLGVHMNHPVQGIVVRGISDRIGDKTPENDQIWQPIAARHAAAFAFQLLSKLPSQGGEKRNTLSEHASPQEVHFGNITGQNLTFNINQHQGPFTQIAGGAPADSNAEIDLAAERILQGKPEVAIDRLMEIRKRRWDSLTARERFRVVANLGQAMERLGDFHGAARNYIEAKEYQPNDEKARSLEATAYAHLGDFPKAYQLALSVLADHPSSSLANAIRVRCAPDDARFTELEECVPTILREDPTVIHELAQRAAKSGELQSAERLARLGMRLCPDSMEFQWNLGAVMLQAEANAVKNGEHPPCANRLAEAVDVLSTALSKAKAPKDLARIRYSRAEVWNMLNEPDAAEADFLAAYDLDKDDLDIPFRFAMFLEARERHDDAIRILQRTVKDGPTPPAARNVIVLANLLGERNQLDDRAAAVRLLHEQIALTQSADFQTRDGIVATLMQLHGALKQHEKALEILDALPVGYISPVVALVSRAHVYGRAGQKEKAIELAREAHQSLLPASPKEEQFRVAEALSIFGRHRDAVFIWKKLLKPTKVDDFVRRALDSARKTGDDSFILSFCKSLRENNVHDDFCLELEVVTRERYESFDDAIALMKNYIESAANDALARVFRVRLSLIRLRLGRPELMVTDPALLPPVESVPVPVAGGVMCVLRHGPNPPDAVTYAYELVRRHFSDAEARQIYVAAMGIGDDLANTFPHPEAVAPGCAVQYLCDDSKVEKWIIIEDAPDPKSEREEIGPNHGLAKELHGKRVGDKFFLRRDELQDRTATILQIWNKYIYRKFEILHTWEDKFHDNLFVRKYSFATKEDGSPDIAPILRGLDRREKAIDELHALYRQHNALSVSTFAQITGISIPEALQHLASDDTLGVPCCMGNNEELQNAERALHGAQMLVIDPSALATLFFSGYYPHLALLPVQRVVCQSTLQQYRDLQRELLSPTAGFMAKRKGKYIFRQDDGEERKLQHRRIGEFLAAMESLVTIESGERLANLDPDNRKELIDLFGQPTAESIAIAGQEAAVLWTDDLGAGEVGRERMGTRRLWTQLVFQSMESSGKLPTDTYIDLSIFLLSSNYFFTRMEPPAILAACRKSNWVADSPPFSAVIRWLSAPELLDQSVPFICINSLPLIWRHADLVHQRENATRGLAKAVLARKNGRRLLAQICGAIEAAFGLDVCNAQDCKGILLRMLRAETSSRLIIPGQRESLL